MATLKSVNQWFGGRLLKPQDRLSSIGKYFPYGEDRYTPTPANPANGTEKFATYTRDTETGWIMRINGIMRRGWDGLPRRIRAGQMRMPKMDRIGIRMLMSRAIRSTPLTPAEW